MLVCPAAAGGHPRGAVQGDSERGGAVPPFDQHQVLCPPSLCAKRWLCQCQPEFPLVTQESAPSLNYIPALCTAVLSCARCSKTCCRKTPPSALQAKRCAGALHGVETPSHEWRCCLTPWRSPLVAPCICNLTTLRHSCFAAAALRLGCRQWPAYERRLRLHHQLAAAAGAHGRRPLAGRLGVGNGEAGMQWAAAVGGLTLLHSTRYPPVTFCCLAAVPCVWCVQELQQPHGGVSAAAATAAVNPMVSGVAEAVFGRNLYERTRKPCVLGMSGGMRPPFIGCTIPCMHIPCMLIPCMNAAML